MNKGRDHYRQLKLENEAKLAGHPVKLMPCKPFQPNSRSRRLRQHTWVRI